jgi:hypothetical protein
MDMLPSPLTAANIAQDESKSLPAEVPLVETISTRVIACREQREGI